MSTKHFYVGYTDGFCDNNGTPDATFGGSFALFDIGDRDENDWFFHKGKDIHDYIQDKDLEPVIFNSRLDFATSNHYPAATNNAAEACIFEYAVNCVLEKGMLHPGNKVVLFLDSDLIRNQVLGVYKAKNAVLCAFVKRIKQLKEDFKKANGGSMEEILLLKRVSGNRMKTTIINH